MTGRNILSRRIWIHMGRQTQTQMHSWNHRRKCCLRIRNDKSSKSRTSDIKLLQTLPPKKQNSPITH